MVEIAKALAVAPRVLILDEPTAPLGARESQLLFDAIARLKAQGLAILYVSHRFAEVLALCDVVTVLRNGRQIVTTTVAGWTEARLTEAMIGSAAQLYESAPRPRGAAASSCAISPGQRLRGVGLTLHSGEIVAVTELWAPAERTGRIVGGDLVPRPARSSWRPPAPLRRAERCGCRRHLHAHRGAQAEGIMPNLSVRENIGIGSLRALGGPLGIVSTAREAARTDAAAQSFGVVAASLALPIRSLSGGNQQKALVARWHLADMDVFVLIEPTRGVDVGARADIYRRLDALARAGKAILVISSDIAEVLTLADRILVVRDGRIAAEIGAGEESEEGLNLLVQGAAAA